jgi:hypothetical protein
MQTETGERSDDGVQFAWVVVDDDIEVSVATRPTKASTPQPPATHQRAVTPSMTPATASTSRARISSS